MEKTPAALASLQTPRVSLVQVGDKATLAQAFELVSIPDIKTGLEFPRTLSARQFAGHLEANPALRCFLLIPHGNDQPVGMVVYWGNTPVVGCGQILYAIHPDHRGQGIAIEASRVLLNHLFEREAVQGVGAFVALGNEASRQVLVRLGMRPVGYGRTNMIFYFVGCESHHVKPLDRLIQRVDWSKSCSRIARLAAVLYGLMITNTDL